MFLSKMRSKMSVGLILASCLLATGAASASPERSAVRQELEPYLQRHAVKSVQETIRSGRWEQVLSNAALHRKRLVGKLAAPTNMKCLPTCDPADGRFLAIAGANLVTLSDSTLNLEISVPAGTTSFQFGVFDGDGGQNDAVGDSHWDTGDTAIYDYDLFADPATNGTGTTPVELQPGVFTVTSDTMPDNDWIDFTVATSAAAAAPSGNFFYRLSIKLEDPSLTTLNAFKVRTSGIVTGLTFDPQQKPFSYIANWTDLADISIVYPNFPDTTGTTYDGTFHFFFDVPAAQSEVFVWDGDFDRGKFDGTDQDTDDPDTPGAPFLPSWATADAVPEGVAVGLPGTTGNPADDNDPADFGVYVVRSPSVQYDLLFPDGQSFHNDNPSGNQEWEQFKVSTAPFNRSQMDYHTGSVPPGTYDLKVSGVDMQNLNALLIPFRLLCVDATGTPCTALRPYLIGDTVYTDANGNAQQDTGEAGIAGVTLNLVDAGGNVLATTTTNAAGHYSFPAESGSYTVVVTAANFNTGGALAGTTSTTGNSLTRTVGTANVLTYDFGYKRNAPAPGTGTLGYWKNHPEAWPVATIVVGGITYTKAQAISIMGNPGKGDKSYDMYKQLVSAKLNALVGNDVSCIAATIQSADSWQSTYPPGSKVSSSGAAWAVGGPLQVKIDSYNNGNLCAPHRN
jgi:hypothetical protein